MDRAIRRSIREMYRRLYRAFGPQYWWPGETPFEVIVGAILTQNTNWGNVEKAIANLKKHRCLSVKKFAKLSAPKLAALIRPAGYFNVKAKRLKNFMRFLSCEYRGSLKLMARQDMIVLRRQLLSVNGIGPETADSILLYAFGKPVFVVDAYTKRILSRHRLINSDCDYQEAQNIFMRNLKHDVKMFNEYHALIVRVGKEMCKTRPQCENCPLVGMPHEI